MQADFTQIAATFLDGFFQSVSAAVPDAGKPRVTNTSEVEAGRLAGQAEQFNALLTFSTGTGETAALLLPAKDATRLAALASGETALARDTLGPEDAGPLGQVFEPWFAAGVEALGISPATEPALAAQAFDDAAIADLIDILGQAAGAAEFQFALETDEEAAAVLLLGPAWLRTVPQAAEQAPASAVNADELNDILDRVGMTEEEILGRAEKPAPPKTPQRHERNIDMILDVRLNVTARLGRVEMPIGEILGLGPGSIIEVGHNVDEPVELLVNGKLIARGDVVVVDEKFGLRITEIVSTQERIESLR